VCFILDKSLPPVMEFLSMSPFSYIHHRFYALPSCIHIRFFTDEFRVKIHKKNRHPKVFSFGICNVAHSIKAKEKPYRFDVNLHSMIER